MNIHRCPACAHEFECAWNAGEKVLPRFVQFTDSDGHEVNVDRSRIVSIREADPTRVHDHGSVLLDTGGMYGFSSDSGPELLLKALNG